MKKRLDIASAEELQALVDRVEQLESRLNEHAVYLQYVDGALNATEQVHEHMKERIKFSIRKVNDLQRLNNTITSNTGETLMRLIKGVTSLKNDMSDLAGALDTCQQHVREVHDLHVSLTALLHSRERESEKGMQLPKIRFDEKGGSS